MKFLEILQRLKDDGGCMTCTHNDIFEERLTSTWHCYCTKHCSYLGSYYDDPSHIMKHLCESWALREPKCYDVEHILEQIEEEE